MALVLIVLTIVMLLITWRRPRTEPVRYPTSELDTTVPRSSYVLGALVCILTAALYIIFW